MASVEAVPDAMPAAHRAPHAPPPRARNRPSPSVPPESIVERLCKQSEFQGTFRAPEFIATLSEPHLAKTRGEPVFDAHALVDTFGKALAELRNIRTNVTGKCASLNSAVQVSQSVYTKKLRQLSNNFDATQTSFDALQTRISEVGRIAIRIGEQLEALDRQRMRASETYDLIQYYYMFARGDTSRLDKLRNDGGREGRLKAAMIARRLAAISREVDMPGSAATRDAVDAYCEQFERDMLKLFDKYYRRSDPKMMSHIAHVLQSFNGGVSCIQLYVNQHDFFISKDRVVEAERIGASRVWDQITDPSANPPRTEPSLHALFAEIRDTVELEAQIIAAVFPNALLVMQTFLQRVFAQSVQGYIEAIMQRAQEIDLQHISATARLDPTADVSGLAFLRMLHVTRSSALALVGDLKTIDLRSAGITVSNAPLGIPSGLDGVFSYAGAETDALAAGALLGHHYSAAQVAAAGGSPLGAMLDQAVEEIFSPYLDHIKYIDRECRVLSMLYATALQPFFEWHRSMIKASRANATIFSRVREQFTGSATASFGSSVAFATLADNQNTQNAPVSSFKKLVDRARGAVSEEEVPKPLDDPNAPPDARGELDLSLASDMLRWHAEVLGRCMDLSTATEVPKCTFALLRVLTDAFLKAYVEAALETTTVQLFAYDGRSAVAPDLDIFVLVMRVEQLVTLWQHYVQTAVLPLTAPSVTIRREIGIYNNHNILRVEGKCEALLQKFTDNMLAYFSATLATQKKSDYSPKNDDVMFARLNTDPCLAIVEVLGRLNSDARKYLSQRTQETLFAEIGLGLHALLLEHLKKFTVSATGGLMLTKDLAMYQDACNTFQVQTVSARFEMLRQLGNLFIVQPSVLNSYMREGHLGKIDEALLKPYLLRRQDYTREVRDLRDDKAAEQTSSSLFASLNLGSLGLHDAAAQSSADADAARFLTDLDESPEWMEPLMRRPSKLHRTGSPASPSTTPHSSQARNSPLGVSPEPARVGTSRTPSPVQMRRDRMTQLNNLVQDFEAM
ncbi:Exocyst complex component 5 [Malassezia vespertilionis]|uniref:Sec10p n=1 Tax=Malassezia vespertilionis TaxID=2020962 RepID=A0A2N1JEX5_9BASI|nr:Exocyst complex component 5 [Malassezia vespertilionis]PKI85075.1 Sec10p [Malassezia vespertilionis]WFD05868.1 Exocyst complex component 5 [Malassezia vespertilionis]